MNRLLMLVLLAVSFMLSACEKKEEYVLPKTAESAKQESATASMPAADQAKQLRNEFVGKMQQDLDEMNTKLGELKAKAQTLTGEAKVKIDQQIQSLEQEQKAAVQKFEELKSATGEKWSEMKTGVGDAVEHLKQSVKKARGEGP